MVQTFGGNENGDIYIGSDGNIVVLSVLPAIVAACETATRAQYGEMILAQKSGIPNFETIWIGSPKYKQFEAYLRNTLLSVSGVQDVSNLTLRVNQGVLSYTATIKTQFGSGVVSG